MMAARAFALLAAGAFVLACAAAGASEAQTRAREAAALLEKVKAAKDLAAAKEELCTYAERHWAELRKDVETAEAAAAAKDPEGKAEAPEPPAARRLLELALCLRAPVWSEEALAEARCIDDWRMGTEMHYKKVETEGRAAQREYLNSQEAVRKNLEIEEKKAEEKRDKKAEMLIREAGETNIRANQKTMENSGLEMAFEAKHTYRVKPLGARLHGRACSRLLQLKQISAKPRDFPFGGRLPETYDWDPSVVSFAQRTKLKVSFEFEDAPLQTALREISVLSGVPVVLDKGLEETTQKIVVSLRVTEMSMDTATEWVAKLSDLRTRVDTDNQRIILESNK